MINSIKKLVENIILFIVSLFILVSSNTLAQSITEEEINTYSFFSEEQLDKLSKEILPELFKEFSKGGLQLDTLSKEEKTIIRKTLNKFCDAIYTAILNSEINLFKIDEKLIIPTAQAALINAFSLWMYENEFSEEEGNILNDLLVSCVYRIVFKICRDKYPTVISKLGYNKLIIEGHKGVSSVINYLIKFTKGGTISRASFVASLGALMLDSSIQKMVDNIAEFMTHERNRSKIPEIQDFIYLNALSACCIYYIQYAEQLNRNDPQMNTYICAFFDSFRKGFLKIFSEGSISDLILDPIE